jgi:hypothetical protein
MTRGACEKDPGSPRAHLHQRDSGRHLVPDGQPAPTRGAVAMGGGFGAMRDGKAPDVDVCPARNSCCILAFNNY